jgi:hypothetical protein
MIIYSLNNFLIIPVKYGRNISSLPNEKNCQNIKGRIKQQHYIISMRVKNSSAYLLEVKEVTHCPYSNVLFQIKTYCSLLLAILHLLEIMFCGLSH